MVKSKKGVIIDVEGEVLEDMIEEVAKQLHNLHIELFEMLNEVRELQMLVLKNKAPHLEVIENEKVNIDIIDLS
jgi:hypothetical protein